MHNFLLLNSDNQRFDVAAIERIFQSERGFRDVRFHEPGGAIIEADYIEPEDSTIVGLSGSRKSISLSGTSDAALQAALILQNNLPTPLRMADTDYSFDLILSGFSSIEELQAAIDAARSS
jgi:hypothetical protein